MSLGDALGYPFKDGNITKILPIAIVYAIIMYIFISSSFTGNILFVCGGGIALFAFSFFISGYYVDAIAQVQHNNDQLPDPDISKNIGRGVAATLASIVYFLPLIIIAVLVIAITGVSVGASGDSGAGAGLGLLVICGGGIAAFIASIALSLGYVIGLCRYAAEETTGALFDVFNNTKLAWDNGGESAKLIGRAIILGILSAIISGIFSVLVNSMFPVNDPFWEPTTAFWLMYSLSQVVLYTVSLIFALAYMYLAAHYGMNLGIGGRKMKNSGEAYEF